MLDIYLTLAIPAISLVIFTSALLIGAVIKKNLVDKSINILFSFGVIWAVIVTISIVINAVKQMSKPNEVDEALKKALQVGYRHLDCAHECEKGSEVDEVLEESMGLLNLTINDVFITSKVREMISDSKKTLIQSLSSKSWPSEEEKSRVLQSVCLISINYLCIKSIHYVGREHWIVNNVPRCLPSSIHRITGVSN
ncbi:unnamed protein product [Schistosoma turkestanicum]|nr:unnamed protein product [Schistosoma turkestanicum]